MKVEFDRAEFDRAMNKLDSFGGPKAKQKILNAFNRAGFTARKKIMDDMPSIFKKLNQFTQNSVIFEQLRYMQSAFVGGIISFRKKTKGGVGAGIYLMPEEHGGRRMQNGLEYQLSSRGLIGRNQYLMPAKSKPSNVPNPSWIIKTANALARGTVSPIGYKKGKVIKARSGTTEMFLLTQQHGKLAPGLYMRDGKGKAVAYYILVNRTEYKSIFNFYKRITTYFSEAFIQKIDDEMRKG